MTIPTLYDSQQAAELLSELARKTVEPRSIQRYRIALNIPLQAGRVLLTRAQIEQMVRLIEERRQNSRRNVDWAVKRAPKPKRKTAKKGK